MMFQNDAVFSVYMPFRVMTVPNDFSVSFRAPVCGFCPPAAAYLALGGTRATAARRLRPSPPLSKIRCPSLRRLLSYALARNLLLSTLQQTGGGGHVLHADSAATPGCVLAYSTYYF